MGRKKGTAPVLSLVPTTTSKDTIEALERLLALAYAGKVIGLAYVSLEQGMEYSMNAVGEAWRYPTFTYGTLRLLEDHIKKKVAGD